MRTGLSILAGLLVLNIAAAPLCAAKQAAKGKRAGKNAKNAARKKGDRKGAAANRPAFGENLGALAEKVGLSTEQNGRIRKVKESRDKALAKHDRTYGPRVQKAEERLGRLSGQGGRNRQAQGARRQLQGYVQSVSMGRRRLEASYEKKMFLVLTPEQRAKWNGPILLEAVMKEFSLLFLTASQEERLRNLVEAQAKRLALPLDPQKHEDVILAVKKMAYKSILTETQRREYAKLAAAQSRESKANGQKGGNRKGRGGRGKGKGNKGRGKGGGGGGKIVGGGRVIGGGGGGRVIGRGGGGVIGGKGGGGGKRR
jgi:hypothetical protein